MLYYEQELHKINRRVYPRNDLTKKVIEARHFMDQEYTHELNLEKMAGKACLSKFHFIRIFKAHYGRTPYQYLISIRIKNARRCLAMLKSPTDTCYEVGFSSLTYFTGLFKKMTGMTPALYQRKLQKKQFTRSHLPDHS